MILHIGCDEFVPLSSIVAVMDVQSHPELMNEILSQERDGASIQRIGQEEAKSAILTVSGEHRVFFLSPISVQTLRKRVESGSA